LKLIAFQAAYGAYKDVAGLEGHVLQIKSPPCRTFAETFRSAGEGRADFGLLALILSRGAMESVALEGSKPQRAVLTFETRHPHVQNSQTWFEAEESH
jgi:hypothetical protein